MNLFSFYGVYYMILFSYLDFYSNVLLLLLLYYCRLSILLISGNLYNCLIYILSLLLIQFSTYYIVSQNDTLFFNLFVTSSIISVQTIYFLFYYNYYDTLLPLLVLLFLFLLTHILLESYLLLYLHWFRTSIGMTNEEVSSSLHILLLLLLLTL